MRTRTPITLAALTALVAATLTPLAASTPAEAASCKRTPTLLSRKPTTMNLAGGAQARIWDTGATPKSPQTSTRIVAVRIPAKAKSHLKVRGAASLTSARTPGSFFTGAKASAVMVNGGVFNPSRGALPDLPQMTGGKVTKARYVADPVIAISKTGQSSPSRLSLTGSVASSGRGSKAVTGLNWQSVTGSGVNVYTTAWGKQRRPYGAVDVVLVGGKVAAVRKGKDRGKAPASGQTILTANGAAGTWLAKLPKGAKVSVSYKTKSDAKFTVYEAVGRGARFLNKGVKNGGTCGSRDEQLRPRTAVGWMKNGDVLLVTVSGRATVNGARFGGATIHQMADYMQQLGAYDATNLDGGGSTTMLGRTTKGSAVRLDRGAKEAQRAVPNVLSLG